MQKVELKVVSGKQSGNVIELPAGKFLIGREHDCHLRPNSELVSRHHCAFTVDDYTVRVRDLGSTNGTLVNGERIRGATVLKPGDSVSVGKLDFRVAINGDEGAADDETVMRTDGDTLVEMNQAPEQDPNSETLTDFQVGEVAPEPTDEAPLESDTQYISPSETQETFIQPPPTQPVGPAAPDAQQPQPGYPYGYPPPGYPYPQQYGYPPPGYPYPPQPQQAYPPQQQPYQQPEQSAEPAQAERKVPEVSLPDPTTTGAKAPEPAPAPPPPKEGEEGEKQDVHIPTAAKDIINQYLNRRPKSE